MNLIEGDSPEPEKRRSYQFEFLKNAERGGALAHLTNTALLTQRMLMIQIILGKMAGALSPDFPPATFAAGRQAEHFFYGSLLKGVRPPPKEAIHFIRVCLADLLRNILTLAGVLDRIAGDEEDVLEMARRQSQSEAMGDERD